MHVVVPLVVDGRGVDGRGPAWDRAVKFDFGVTVEDQVDALHAAALLTPAQVRVKEFRGRAFGGTFALSGEYPLHADTAIALRGSITDLDLAEAVHAAHVVHTVHERLPVGWAARPVPRTASSR